MNHFRMGTEEMYGNILLTRVNRNPPAYKCETSDDKGNPVVAVLEKAPRGNTQIPGFRPWQRRGWNVILENQDVFGFRTKRDALRFISVLQHKEQDDEDKHEQSGKAIL